MPPSVQWSWVDGSGPKVRPSRSASPRSRSSTTPGSTRASLRRGSISRTRFSYFEKSITTATLNLAGQARAAATGKDRSPVTPADRDCRNGVVGRPRDDDAHGELTIVRAAAGVEPPVTGTEPHLALELPSECRL